MQVKFIADNNVGKLARWLRMMGYDTVLLKHKDDNQMIRVALGENRVVLTKDSQFVKRRLVTSGKLKAIHIKEDNPKLQVQEVMKSLKLGCRYKPFSLCLECNQPLIPTERERVKSRVPVRVFETQSEYRECPTCHRIYWPGTHWQAMGKKLQDLEVATRENYDCG